ncbi:MAG TPA: long-chain fatty acid--CoA ligase [Solirubrobacteraceae bacterium]|jgi:long-chain acyl-CoA synthetase|nr:long-chain fatty acid--CoA ligase [Solirubrobacteraceae bacterium]
MEATATASANAPATGSRTIADLIPLAAAAFGEQTAIRYKRDGAWHDVSYVQLADTVQELALGLIDLGIEPGDRVCILANTRPEWSYADMAASSAGAVVVPIYQTNSPEECLWVISDSDACAIVCENEEQLEKIAAIRDQVPGIRTVIVIDAPSDTIASGASDAVRALNAIPLDDVAARGRNRADATDELEARRAAVNADDPFTFIYTSGTTGPPKGCVLTHGNYRAIIDMVGEAGEIQGDEVIYLYLPLAHSFALLIQLAVFDLGGTLAYFGGDTTQIVAELQEVKPTYLPSVPRVFEKIYTLAQAAIQSKPPEEQAQAKAAIELGVKVRNMLNAGEAIPEQLQKPFEQADEELFKNVRAIFGGNVRHATSGAAPIAHEILEFFWACGVPVLEGYGMTETATAATTSTVANHKFGTVGRALPGVELKIADDGEILIKGPNIFHGYHNNADASFGAIEDGWMHTGDLGSIDADGYLSITGRKKDIIITAGGKNLTPANIENDLKQCRWISQAVMHGDKRPYPVVLITLDEEEMPAFASQHDLPQDIASLAQCDEVRAMIQVEIDRANTKYAQVEQVKKFAILDHDLSQATGELTPTLKVKRNVVNEKYAELFDALYAR